MRPSRSDDAESLTLTPDAWRAFAGQAWDRTPIVIQQPFAHEFPSVADVLGALRASGERILHGTPEAFRLYPECESSALAPHLRFFGARVAAPFPFFPTSADRTMDGYATRLSRALGDRRFGIVLNDCQKHFPLWCKFQGFLRGLGEHITFPTGGASLVAFVGNYKFTPFGIHKDIDHVFTFVVQGYKEILLWPIDALNPADHLEVGPNPIDRDVLAYIRDGAEYRRLMKSAIRLVGRPGDLLYWPQSYWHMALGGDGLAVSLALGVRFVRPPFLTPIPPQLRDVTPPWTSREVVGRHMANGRREPSRRLAQALRRLPRNAFGAQVRDESLNSWIRFVSGAGFDPGPIAPAVTNHPRQADWVYGHPARPIHSTRISAHQVILSANGFSLRCPDDPRIARLVARLNSGIPGRTQDLLGENHSSRRRTDNSTRLALEKLLNAFVNWAAVSVAD